MRLLLLLVLLFSLSTNVTADWWDSFTESVSGGLNSAASWVKETASPTISDKYEKAKEAVKDVVKEKFNQAKEKLQDPETHKTIREWISDKAEKASDFAQTEVLPELKKIYDAATAEESQTESTTSTTTTYHDE